MMFKRFLVAVCATLAVAIALPASAQTAPPNWRPVSPHPQLRSSATPWLGVSLERLSPYYRRYYRVPFQYGGVLVRSVARRSPAARAGLRRGDVIVRIGGKYMYRPVDVVRQVRASRAGRRIRIDLYRFGAWKMFTVRLGRARTPHRSPADPFARPPVRRPPTPGWITRVPGPRGRAIRLLLKQIAQLKREVQALKKKVARLEQHIKGRKTAPAPAPARRPGRSKGAKRGGGTVPPPPPPSP